MLWPDGFVWCLTARQIGVSAGVATEKKMKRQEGTVSKTWKDANVVPIHKKGSKTNPGNYCPISLTSIFCNILGKFIEEENIHRMISNNLLNNAQYGFRSKRSCASQ